MFACRRFCKPLWHAYEALRSPSCGSTWSLDQLRCPCHSTSFSPTGQVLSHMLPSVPEPLPRLEVRELDGSIEVFTPEKPPTEPQVQFWIDEAKKLPVVLETK